MGKIVITTNATLDGVVQDPDGQEGFELGGWFGEFGGKDLEEWTRVETAEALGADALLRRNVLIWGLGGVIAPFIGIKLIDVILVILHLAG